jgi:hypothetical protein
VVGVQVVDIEERVWSPRYGLKGMIDVSMRVATSGQGNSGSALMPFELKTGKKTTGYVRGPSSPLPPLFRLCRGSSVPQRSRQDRWCAVLSKLPGVSPVGLSGASSPYPEVCLCCDRAEPGGAPCPGHPVYAAHGGQVSPEAPLPPALRCLLGMPSSRCQSFTTF